MLSDQYVGEENMQILVGILCGGVAMLLLSAAAGKVIGYGAFATTLERLGIPWRGIPFVAAMIISFEAIMGFMLALGIAWIGIAGSVFFLSLAGVSAWSESRHWRIPCACFGWTPSLLGRNTAARSLGCGVVSLLCGGAGLIGVVPPVQTIWGWRT
jgi:hypothetical protein